MAVMTIVISLTHAIWVCFSASIIPGYVTLGKLFILSVPPTVKWDY